MSADSTGYLFKTDKNLAFPGVRLAQLCDMFHELRSEFGVNDIQIAEASSYSMAMVIRFALGLTAQGGRVCTFVKDCLGGWVALATLRHLTAAGAEGIVFVVGSKAAASETFNLELKPLQRLGIEVHAFDETQLQSVNAVLENSHNVVCGLFDRESPDTGLPTALADTLNESRAPIHCVEAPPGINVDTGGILKDPIFGSSTLSLGAPLQGLNPAKDYVGRHYVCDTSLTEELYRRCGPSLTPLFSEQPVVKITPIEAE